MDDLLGEFLTETAENLDVIDSELIRFEREPNNTQILGNVFRLVHTIKGTCGFLGLPRLETLAHGAETLMGRFRDGAEVTSDGVTTILLSIDRIKMILAALEEVQAEPDGDDNDLIDRLLVLAGVVTQSAAEAPEADVAEADEDSPESAARGGEEGETGEIDTMPEAPMTPAANVSGPDLDGGGELVRALKPGEVPLDELEAAFRNADGPDLSLPSKDAVPDAAKTSGKLESTIANQTIRVNVQTIETLMTMVSELVLTRNQLLEISRRHEDSEFSTPLQRLSNVTGELQDGVMKTRMQPIGNAWGKLPRIIRDLSHELDKSIELEMRGADTELDRQVLELIRDPLTHMVRNSADHGIESPEERRAAGKPETGTVRVAAYHEGGYIIIAIEDDGKGLNTGRLREKAADLGLASETELAAMTDAQIHKFIFHPGFSTAKKVTAVSGRGVGMDVVRTNIDKIGGSLDLDSVEGKGTKVTIKIPLTLAIVAALIVEAGGERYAIPQLAVSELVRANPSGENRIERLKDAEVLRLRDALLPVVRLVDLLGIDGGSSGEPPASGSTFVVVAEVGQQTFGIIVDQVFHTEEIVVKPMSVMLKELGMFSGNTIMGDGSVILIVDPNGVARAVGAAENEDGAGDGRDKDTKRRDAAEMSLLLFEAGEGDLKAVPLSLVTRIEEIDVKTVERTGERLVVQYRGRLMPIVQANPAAALPADGNISLLVFADGERVMGLMVDCILDIVEDRLDMQVSSEVPGALGSAIVNGQATEIIDVGHFLPLAFADWMERKEQRKHAQRRLLYVEDSPFFRDMTLPVLMGAGFEVTVCEDGIEAHELVRQGAGYDLVVTDIEMPNMDGFTLTRMLKGDEKTRDWPVIALSAFTGPEAEARARKVGMFAYVAKFDRAGLAAALKAAVHNNQVEIAA